MNSQTLSSTDQFSIEKETPHKPLLSLVTENVMLEDTKFKGPMSWDLNICSDLRMYLFRFVK